MKEWQQPITTRRYLHPPMSERMVTLWSEGKIILGEVVAEPGPSIPNYNTLISCGIWPVLGKDLESLDFRKTENQMQPKGIPVHGIQNVHGNLRLEIEAFCDAARKCSCFVKICVTNGSDEKVEEQLGLLLRTGIERRLVFGAPDVYESYAPDVDVWKNAACTWKVCGKAYRDGEYFLCPKDGTKLLFDESKGLVYVNVALKAGEQREFVFMLGKGDERDFAYKAERQETIDFYENELKRITNLSEAIQNDTKKTELIQNLTIQMLQCFVKPVGEEYVLCRQGGLQRRVWPYEALYVLEALGKLGDFADYIEPVIEGYFSCMQAENGEIVPLGIHWAMATANVLYSFSEYAMIAGRGYFEKYRQKAIKAFCYMRSTRASTKAEEGVKAGLYPPLRSCDCDLVFQSWTNTDAMNLLGLQRFYEVLKLYEDAYAHEVEQEYQAYHQVLSECFERAKELSDPEEGIYLTSFVPGMPGDETKFAFGAFTGTAAWALGLGAEDVDRLISYKKKHGTIYEGLYWRMPDHYRMVDPDGVMRMWYTTAEEYYWFSIFQSLGRTDACRQIVESMLKYSTTKEGYMLERYHERDPYFVPWSPNASGNGRLLLMLLAM